MSDYISRQAALEALDNIFPTKEGFFEPDEVFEELNAVPTADVVEVVRCKDCKHYGKFGMKCNKLHLTPIESWHYCSFGERAEQGSTDRAEDAYYEAMDIVQEMADMR